MGLAAHIQVFSRSRYVHPMESEFRRLALLVSAAIANGARRNSVVSKFWGATAENDRVGNGQPRYVMYRD
jgi:hypothetical protein